MKLMVNRDIVIDYLCARQPYADRAVRLALLGKLDEVQLWCSSTQVPDMLYVLSGGGKDSCARQVQEEFRKLRQFVGISVVGVEAFDRMASSTWDNLEAELVYEAALEVQADAIVTRRTSAFEKSSIPVLDYDDLSEFLSDHLGIRYEAIEL
jgi:hypothetical protein